MRAPIYLCFILLLFPTSLRSQTDQTIYYNDYGHETSKDSSTWYRTVHFFNVAKGDCEATDYYISGKMKRSKGPYLKDKNGIDPNGAFINYDENGNKQDEGTYLSDRDKGLWSKKIGKWMEYYTNGKPNWEYNYEGVVKDGYNDELVMTYWDSTGTEIIKGGNGHCTYKSKARLPNDTTNADVYVSSDYKNGRLEGQHVVTFAKTGKLFVQEEFTEGKLVKGTSYDAAGKQYNYTKFEENPEFPGGDKELIHFLQNNIMYPKYERKHDIEGKVLIRFVVDTDGRVNEVKVMHSVSKGLDDEAVRVVKLMPKFRPGTYKGQNVRVYFNLPVVYRLQ